MPYLLYLNVIWFADTVAIQITLSFQRFPKKLLQAPGLGLQYSHFTSDISIYGYDILVLKMSTEKFDSWYHSKDTMGYIITKMKTVGDCWLPYVFLQNRITLSLILRKWKKSMTMVTLCYQPQFDEIWKLWVVCV